MKYLLWGLVLYLGWRWVTAPRKAVSSDAADGQSDPSGADAQTVEKMVQCARCGIHLPVSEAVSGNDAQLFCCEAHRNTA
ncbi:MAG: PP0621 family protein [Burkholderiaceae bacterium]|jgi:uncharacterized protein